MQMPVKYFKENKIPNVRSLDHPENPLCPKDWSGIFIPCLPECFTCECILTYFIERVMYLGSIEHIEYAKDAMNNPIAFIRFEYWHDEEEVHQFRLHMENTEYLDVYGIQLVYTTRESANIFNHGNIEKYLSLSYYFQDLSPNAFVRMRIHHKRSPQHEPITETLDNLLYDTALLKEQMQIVMDKLFPKPATYIIPKHDSSIEEFAADIDNVQSQEDDSDSDEDSYPAFHPDEFLRESLEITIMMNQAIAKCDYNIMAECFLKYEKYARDQHCMRCVFDEFCEDNNIDGQMKKLLGVLIGNIKREKMVHNVNCNVQVKL